MNYLYGLLLAVSVFVPLILSFERNLQFYKNWKHLLPSIFTIATIFIIFDIAFTQKGVWGFNPKYHSAIKILGLPIEEYLFFVIIPYASIFLHNTIIFYFPHLQLNNRIAKNITLFLIGISVIMVIFNSEKAYTSYAFTMFGLVLLISIFGNNGLMNRFYLTFLLILIPFMMVNGILTGSLIGDPVVWYNNSENLGIRIITIPIEDVFYGFSLIAAALLLSDILKVRYYGKQLTNTDEHVEK